MTAGSQIYIHPGVTVGGVGRAVHFHPFAYFRRGEDEGELHGLVDGELDAGGGFHLQTVGKRLSVDDGRSLAVTAVSADGEIRA